jgi:tetratricopeptide (TPR) repeat protein
MRTPKLLLAVGLVLAVLLLLIFSRPRRAQRSAPISTHARSTNAPTASASPPAQRSDRWRRTDRPTSPQAAEEIVHQKLEKFAQSRRSLAQKLAGKDSAALSPEVEAFFSAVQSGDWHRIESTFAVINGGDTSAGHADQRTSEVSKMWPAIIDAFGAAEQAHLWPAQALLDYGHSIVDSLRPGMVYVGGTDSSRWVPALVNDTEEGDQHIVITQNGLADTTYLNYVALQFGSRMNTLTEEEQKQAFASYMADARQRLDHDQNFPDEPKQIRPGENVKLLDGKIDAGGQTAIMDINERLLNKILQRNPDLTFAIGESFPLKGTYTDAVPLGPLMELRANATENFTPERASESLDYWRQAADLVLNDPEASASQDTTRSYSHDATAAANLLAAHGFTAEAESAYLVARQLWPGSPDVAADLSELYQRTGRTAEARQLLEDFTRQFPDQRKSLKDLWGITVGDPAP